MFVGGVPGMLRVASCLYSVETVSLTRRLQQYLVAVAPTVCDAAIVARASVQSLLSAPLISSSGGGSSPQNRSSSSSSSIAAIAGGAVGGAVALAIAVAVVVGVLKRAKQRRDPVSLNLSTVPNQMNRLFAFVVAVEYHKTHVWSTAPGLVHGCGVQRSSQRWKVQPFGWRDPEWHATAPFEWLDG